jgi:hypothetical protein
MQETSQSARQLSGSSFPVTRNTSRNILIPHRARQCLPDTSEPQRLTGNANGRPIILLAKSYRDNNRPPPLVGRGAKRETSSGELIEAVSGSHSRLHAPAGLNSPMRGYAYASALLRNSRRVVA